MISRSLRGFDWVLFSIVLLLGGMGLVSLASISPEFFQRQLVWYSLAIPVIFLGSQLNWQWFFTQKWFRQGLYWFGIGLLLIPYIQNQPIRGARSWIIFGNLRFEPAEIVKVALIIVLAGFFSKKYLAAWQNKNILTSLFYAIVPGALITFQPDLGSASVIMAIWAGFLLMSGINKKRFLIGVGIVALTAILLWIFVMHPYQKQRVIAFLSPSTDLLGVNYNVTQAKVAIGSAGFFGKGFGEGTQTQLGFLPEAHTDFLFAAFVEEWGVLGGIILLLTYLGFIFKIASTGLKVRRNDLKFVVLGTALVFLVHFFINIGSNLGLVPVIGISLPLVSYGGSNLLTSAILISIVERIKIESTH